VIGAGANVGRSPIFGPVPRWAPAARSAPSWRPRTLASGRGQGPHLSYLGDAVIGEGANIGPA
jgi:hypothetical protein